MYTFVGDRLMMGRGVAREIVIVGVCLQREPWYIFFNPEIELFLST